MRNGDAVSFCAQQLEVNIMVSNNDKIEAMVQLSQTRRSLAQYTTGGIIARERLIAQHVCLIPPLQKETRHPS